MARSYEGLGDNYLNGLPVSKRIKMKLQDGIGKRKENKVSDGY